MFNAAASLEELEGSHLRTKLTPSGKAARQLCVLAFPDSKLVGAEAKARRSRIDAILAATASEDGEGEEAANPLSKEDLPQYDFSFDERLVAAAEAHREALATGESVATAAYQEYSKRRTIREEERAAFKMIGSSRSQESKDYVLNYILTTEEAARAAIDQEFTHFYAFCSSNEPTWRFDATQRAARREVWVEAEQYKRRWFAEDVEGIFMAARFQEEEERPERVPVRTNMGTNDAGVRVVRRDTTTTSTTPSVRDTRAPPSLIANDHHFDPMPGIAAAVPREPVPVALATVSGNHAPATPPASATNGTSRKATVKSNDEAALDYGTAEGTGVVMVKRKPTGTSSQQQPSASRQAPPSQYGGRGTSPPPPGAYQPVGAPPPGYQPQPYQNHYAPQPYGSNPPPPGSIPGMRYGGAAAPQQGAPVYGSQPPQPQYGGAPPSNAYGAPSHLTGSNYSAGAGANYAAPPGLANNQWNQPQHGHAGRRY